MYNQLMVKYVALLRGINVGGNNKVEMKKLKEIMQTLSFKNVSTYINSGNILFESKYLDKEKLAKKIEEAISKKFGFSIPTVVRNEGDIKKLLNSIPKNWENNTEQKTDILFLWDKFDNKKTLGLIKQAKGIDNLIYIKGEIVWNISRKNYSKSGMNKFIGTVVYKNMTARNINTVRKLFEIMNK